MATLPRGIRLIKWKNKDGTKSVRYRVRRELKNKETKELEVIDKTFETAKEAEEFLKLSKTVKGKELIYSITDEEKRKAEEYKDFITEPPLRFYIDQYLKKFIDTKINFIDEKDKKRRYLKQRSINSIKNLYNPIKETEIEYKHGTLNSGLFTLTGFPKKKLGEFRIREIGTAEINDYIRTRLSHKTKAGTFLKKSSVSREISLFSVFYRHLIDGELDSKFIGIDNIVLTYNRRLLANANKKRKFVLTEEMEKKLFEELERTNNKELLPIAKLSLYTAMRRSELLLLKWQDINFTTNRIFLEETKNGTSREVYILPEVKDLLEALPKGEANDYVFKTPFAGFEGTFNKLKARIGLKEVRFHDLRRQAIRNMILRLAGATGNLNNSVIIAELLGVSRPAKLEENHITPLKNEIGNGITSQEKAVKNIGHYNSDQTYNYFNL